MAVRHDPLPVLLDHRGELLVGLQPLPPQRLAPLLEEPQRPTRRLVVPELPERLLEQIGRMQALVGLEQQLERRLAPVAQVMPPRQQGVLLPLDVAAALPRQAGVFALADLIQRLLQMAQHVELVEDDQGLGGVPLLEGAVPERLPHVHDRQPDFRGLLGAQPGVEQVQAGLRAVRAAEPDRPAQQQVADDDPVAVPLADGNLIDADHRRRGRAGLPELLGHVLLVQLLDGLPIEAQLLGDRLDRAVATALAHVEGETLRVEGVVGEPGEPFGLHASTPPTGDAPDGEGQIDPLIATSEVTQAAWPLVVEARETLTTGAASRFFRRRRKVSRTAWGSSSRSWIRAQGTKPGKRYRSRSCCGDGIAPS